MFWQTNDPDALGFIPMFLSEADPRPAREQLHTAYAHGGGWDPFIGFTFDARTNSIKYPEDPPLFPIGSAKLHDKEMIFIYPHAWVLILQIATGKWEIARMD